MRSAPAMSLCLAAFAVSIAACDVDTNPPPDDLSPYFVEAVQGFAQNDDCYKLRIARDTMAAEGKAEAAGWVASVMVETGC